MKLENYYFYYYFFYENYMIFINIYHELIKNIHCFDTSWKISNSNDCYIICTAECNTRIPLAKLHAKTISNISEQTLHRRLHEARIRKWKAIDRSLINKKQARQRLAWTKAHRHWTVEDWRKVL